MVQGNAPRKRGVQSQAVPTDRPPCTDSARSEEGTHQYIQSMYQGVAWNNGATRIRPRGGHIRNKPSPCVQPNSPLAVSSFRFPSGNAESYLSPSPHTNNPLITQVTTISGVPADSRTR